jgi:hypothetical protein
MTKSKYDQIKHISIQFTEPTLNRLASDTIDDTTLLPQNKPDPFPADLPYLLRNEITDILLDVCHRTTNVDRVPILVDVMTFTWTNSNGDSRRLRTQAKIIAAFNEAIDDNCVNFVITAHCDALYFSSTFNGLNFDDISSTPFTPSTTRPSTATTAIAPSILSVTPPTDIFNYHALPPSVKQRYDAHKDPNIITPLDLLTPLTWLDGSKHNYYEDPTVIKDRIILRNGAVLEGERDHKRFTRQPPTCSNTTTSALRIWYRSFTTHALSCGYYVVPYDLLDKLHGSNEGFEFGIDLPSSKTPEYFHWQNDISRLLQQNGMFPVGSEFFNRVRTATNGYHALLNLLHDTHPKYVSSPITLAPDWPHQQSDQTLFEFYSEFTEIIRLRAIFMQGTQDFSSIDMVDLFIQRCTHSKYLTHLSRFDRHDPRKADLFKPGILQITLNNYLSEPDSPLKSSSKPSSGGKHPYKKPWEGKSDYKSPY